ncbi:MAG: DUF2757 family protein [Dethiobacter sp.]|jgi:hypothetical protein|nr:DUF2757 family protein [Dethiobacter sp.]
MLLTWICRNCGERLASVTAREDDPRIEALTAQAGDDIIEYDHTGTMIIKILCEDCLEDLKREEESEITFLQGPQLH